MDQPSDLYLRRAHDWTEFCALCGKAAVGSWSWGRCAGPFLVSAQSASRERRWRSRSWGRIGRAWPGHREVPAPWGRAP